VSANTVVAAIGSARVVVAAVLGSVHTKTVIAGIIGAGIIIVAVNLRVFAISLIARIVRAGVIIIAINPETRVIAAGDCSIYTSSIFTFIFRADVIVGAIMRKVMAANCRIAEIIGAEFGVITVDA